MDTTRLELEMARRKISNTDMCSLLGISLSAFYRKRKGLSEFTHKEMQKMISILQVDNPMEIFFADKVS